MFLSLNIHWTVQHKLTQLKHSVINQLLPGYRTLQDTGRRLSSNRWCLLKNNHKFYCKAATTVCLIPPTKNHISATEKTRESNFLSLRTTPRGHASYVPSVCRQHGAHRLGMPCPVLLAQRQLQVKCLNTRTLLLPCDFILHWKGWNRRRGGRTKDSSFHSSNECRREDVMSRIVAQSTSPGEELQWKHRVSLEFL